MQTHLNINQLSRAPRSPLWGMMNERRLSVVCLVDLFVVVFGCKLDLDRNGAGTPLEREPHRVKFSAVAVGGQVQL